jgi:hypothetical protein
MKRKTPKSRLNAMPSGTELERIARRILTELGNNVARPWLAIYDRKKEADPFTAPLDMAGKFIPIIEAWIDQSGRSLLVSLDQQDADQWLVRAPEVLQAAREAVLDLCNETVEQFTTDTLRTLEGIRLDIAASIESGETAGELTDRISTWVKDNARWRARRIAITESARAYNTGLVKAAESLDFVAGWELLVSGDACPMCHMIYRLCPIIPKGGTFGTNGNNKTYKDLKFPPFHPGCRCSLLEVFDDEMPKELKPPARPGENGYLRPSEADYETADQGGYLSVAIGNAKSFTKTGRILES